MADRLSPADELLHSQAFRDSLFNHQATFSDLFEDDAVAGSESMAHPMSSVETDVELRTDDGVEGCYGLETQEYDAGSFGLTKKRDRFKYSKRKLLADYRLYLKTECTVDLRASAVPSWKTYKMRGIIVECPNKKKNGGCFVVEWNEEDHRDLDSMWLQTRISNGNRER